MQKVHLPIVKTKLYNIYLTFFLAKIRLDVRNIKKVQIVWL